MICSCIFRYILISDFVVTYPNVRTRDLDLPFSHKSAGLDDSLTVVVIKVFGVSP